MAMRAATRSSGDITPSGRISPRRTCSTTPRSNCDAQAAQATQAASASAHSSVARRRLPRVPEAARQRIADDEHEDGGDGGERQQRGHGRTGDVGHSMAGWPTHRRGRS